MVFEGRPPTASTPAVPRYFERGVGAVSALEEVCKNHRVIIGPAAVHDLVALCEERVREHGSVGGRRFLSFLECLVTVDRMPVRENQEVVLKEFLALPRAQHSVLGPMGYRGPSKRSSLFGLVCPLGTVPGDPTTPRHLTLSVLGAHQKCAGVPQALVRLSEYTSESVPHGVCAEHRPRRASRRWISTSGLKLV